MRSGILLLHVTTVMFSHVSLQQRNITLDINSLFGVTAVGINRAIRYARLVTSLENAGLGLPVNKSESHTQICTAAKGHSGIV